MVTAIGPDGPVGATANAVTSLSLEPPLMLACLDRRSRTLEAIQAVGRFSINALAGDQEELARRFSTKDPHEEKWAEVEWSEAHGSPRLAGVSLWIACELREVNEGGDHLILTGAVLAAEADTAVPLVFAEGEYRPL